ncbi:hypothetical protein GOBAR_AA16301 [Gossypium barbadense]|uniref:Uncharacterized protein n=1 Tax=Gossypium barbadense TaxID=3634 RepID=A0A2P5XLY2_GOSBA|nr:hypothetical protein GOBAR_AA16301 [Gossypium barbadense]
MGKKGEYKFSNNALVDKDGDSDAEYADESEVAASPAKVMLQILSRTAQSSMNLFLFASIPPPIFDSFPFLSAVVSLSFLFSTGP